MMYSFKLMFLFVFCSISMYAQHPDDVEQNLKKAGANRAELEKAIVHCQNSNDSLKLNAIYFLIANMDIHYSADYYWESKEGKKIDYNELDYPDFDQAAKAFEVIKTQNPELKPKPFKVNDLETIEGNFLIENLEQAFNTWRNSPIKNISFDTFCEYILPYRISIEPLQKWRDQYAEKFSWITKKIENEGLETSLYYVKDEANSWFSNTWGKGGRKEPLPRLGSQQLLLRKQGLCSDVADLGVFTMRSLGIPATMNLIPFWATATGNHATNTFFDTDARPIPFDYGATTYNEKLLREPAKVLRITYSKQPKSLANHEQKANIPSGFLQDSNYIDVTQDYWQTTTLKSVLNPNVANPKTAYLAAFNGLKWQTFWWGKINSNQTQWDKICVGTVVLPQYYLDKKMIPAAYPIIVGEKENKVLTPDYTQLQTISITSFASYLLIKPNVSYKLFYWDNQWKLVGSQIATEITENLLFEKVPKNALLLLVASDTKGLERPFIVDNNGVRTWF